MNPPRGRGSIAANVLAVVVTALSVSLTVARASGELIGGGIILLLVLWAVYDLWLRWFGGHPATRQWPNALVSFGVALGVTYTAYSATHLAIDVRGTNENTTVDGLATMAGVVILALAVGVEVHRIERDRNRVTQQR